VCVSVDHKKLNVYMGRHRVWKVCRLFFFFFLVVVVVVVLEFELRVRI
jgi:hypothetical protein